MIFLCLIEIQKTGRSVSHTLRLTFYHLLIGRNISIIPLLPHFPLHGDDLTLGHNKPPVATGQKTLQHAVNHFFHGGVLPEPSDGVQEHLSDAVFLVDDFHHHEEIFLDEKTDAVASGT